MKLEYYSTLLDRKQPRPKCVSDDNLEYSSPSYDRNRESGRSFSVTEPSTPTAPKTSYEPESELSDTGSQSSVLSDANELRKKPKPRIESLSNSLESFHEPRPRRLKKPKAIRKVSASSTSSYDSRPEPITRRMRKSASCHAKGKEEARKDWRERDPVGDTCRYLLDVLQTQSYATKSLPRNHKPHTAVSRRLNDALRCEKDCLKILKSVSKEKAPMKEEPRAVSSSSAAYSRRGDSEESYFESRSCSLPKKSSKARYPKTAEIKKLKSITAVRREPSPTRYQTIERLSEDSAKKREKKECVLRIEDGDLWIEICKAVQETETRARKARKNFPYPKD